jgi:hypothetical protein
MTPPGAPKQCKHCRFLQCLYSRLHDDPTYRLDTYEKKYLRLVSSTKRNMKVNFWLDRIYELYPRNVAQQ